MKKLFLIFITLIMVSPAFATTILTDDNTKVVTASYVKGAYDALNDAKQAKLKASDVTESGSGPVVSSVTANDGTVVVTKSEIKVPVGSESSPTSHASIWIE